MSAIANVRGFGAATFTSTAPDGSRGIRHPSHAPKPIYSIALEFWQISSKTMDS